MKSSFSNLFYLAAIASLRGVSAGLPEKVYGVNIGGWLLIEPWMNPTEWQSMGGEKCDDCSTCIGSEFALAKAYPDTVEQRHQNHWETWFSQSDVDGFVDSGINLVRIPLGYWIVEDIVDRRTEFYPKGGLPHLKRGLRQLKAAGIKAILDHHALPGVSSANQMFAGNCTSEVKFYSDYNYHRALVWTAVMTTLSHWDPDFQAVVGIEAINEPTMDANQTPGLGDFQKNFVSVIRAVEIASGIKVPGLKSSVSVNVDLDVSLSASSGFNATMHSVVSSSIFNPAVSAALIEALPILLRMGALPVGKPAVREALTTNFMDVNWQYNNPANPADAANGPQVYDNHLYYSFGGVADPNEEAYLLSMCNLHRIQDDAAKGNSPLYFGEWSLATQFDATDEFIKKWADAQKLMYSQGQGWIFWNFKLETDTNENRQWSYQEGLRRGYLTKNPAAFNDPNVCKNYTGVTTTASSSSAVETSTTLQISSTSDVPVTSTSVSVATSVAPSSSASAAPVTSATTVTSAFPEPTTSVAAPASSIVVPSTNNTKSSTV